MRQWIGREAANKSDGVAAIQSRLLPTLGVLSVAAAAIFVLLNTWKRCYAARETPPSTAVQALGGVMPEAERFGPAVGIRGKASTVYLFAALRESRPIGIGAIGSSLNGYGGRLTVVLGMDTHGIIGRVMVADHNETSGIGTLVTDDVLIHAEPGHASAAHGAWSKSPQNPVLASFWGKDIKTAPWRIAKNGGDIHAISGATVSSRAVTEAVNTIAAAIQAQRAAR